MLNQRPREVRDIEGHPSPTLFWSRLGVEPTQRRGQDRMKGGKRILVRGLISIRKFRGRVWDEDPFDRILFILYNKRLERSRRTVPSSLTKSFSLNLSLFYYSMINIVDGPLLYEKRSGGLSSYFTLRVRRRNRGKTGRLAIQDNVCHGQKSLVLSPFRLGHH